MSEDNSIFDARLYTDAAKVFDEEIGFNDDLKETFVEIRRRTAAIIMQVGESVLFLPRLREGDRCPHWSEEQQNCSDPLGDPSCYGTGFIGGYNAPIKIFVRIVPAGTVQTWYEEGIKKERTQRSWTLWTPILREKDMIVKPTTGERFQLINVAVTGMQRGLVTRQEFDLREVHERDTLMKVPIAISET